MSEISLNNNTNFNDILSLDNEHISTNINNNNQDQDLFKNRCLINTKKRINKIVFNTHYYGVSNFIIVEKNKLDNWRKISEYIDVLMSSYHDNETLHLHLNDIVDLYSLIMIFNFFDTNKIIVIEQEYKIKVLNGLAYFGINSEILNSIKKGFGLVWKLCDVDTEINENERELKNKINEIKIIKMDNLSCHEDNSKDEIYKLNEYKKMDENILLNKDTYNLLYEKLHENIPTIKKQYEAINTIKNIYPEFDLGFIKREFERLSNNIFNDLDDCIVTGGMVSKHFTYNSYFKYTDYDVFLFTNSQSKALEIIKTLYDRLSSKMKTYIIKTKNTIILYNKKFEVQIITKLYNNITEIFTNFDLDSCCVGYSNGKLYGLPRFIRSLAYSGNIFDPERQSSSYIHRLKKYVKRDFTLYVPGLKKSDPDYNKDNYIVRKMREKTDIFEKDSDYCDFFVLIKNRDNEQINSILEQFHKKNKFLDTFEIKNIDDIDSKFKINWNIENIIKKEDYYKDMYFSNYII